MKPTKEQEAEVWEWCGYIRNDNDGCWKHPDGNNRTYLPQVTLNNLFRYAVPKVGYVILSNWNKKKLPTASVFDGEGNCFMSSDKDPALALFWAIYKVIKGE